MDGFDWHQFAWEPLTLALSTARDWDLADYTWVTLTVTISGSETISFSQSGTRQLSGTGTRDLDQGIPGLSGLETYAYSGTLDYSWAVTGTSSFSLSQTGSFANGLFTLTNSTLTRSGSHAFAYSESGQLNLTGTGTRTATDSYALDQSGPWSGGSYQLNSTGEVVGHETYSFGGNLSYAYSENGSGSFIRSEQGVYQDGAFALGSLLFSQEAAGSYTLTELRTATIEGDGVRQTGQLHHYDGTTHLGGASGQGLHSATRSGQETYHFLGSQTQTRDLAGTASASLYQYGSLDSTGLALGSFLYEQTSQESYSFSAAELRAFDGVGTFTTGWEGSNLGSFSADDGTLAGTTAGNGTGADFYQVSGTAQNSYTLSGNESFTLRQEGSFSGGSYALSGVRLDAEAAHTLQFQASESTSLSGSGWRSSSSAGSALGTLAAAGQGGGGLAENTHASFDAYSFSATASSLLSGTLAATTTLHQEGSFAGGSLALASLALQAATTLELQLELAQNTTRSGSGVSTSVADYAGSGTSSGPARSLPLGTLEYGSGAAQSRIAVESYSFTETSAVELAVDLNHSRSTQAVGTYANHAVSLDSLTIATNAQQSFNLDLQSNASLTAEGAAGKMAVFTILGNLDHADGTGASSAWHTFSVDESYLLVSQSALTLALTGQATQSSHAVGSAVGHEVALSSLVLQDSSNSLLTLEAFNYLHLTASGTDSQESSSGSLGTTSRGGMNSFDNTAGASSSGYRTSSYSYAETSDSLFTYLATSSQSFWGVGQYANHSLALSSFSIDSFELGTYALTAHHELDQASSGTFGSSQSAHYDGSRAFTSGAGSGTAAQQWEESASSSGTFTHELHTETSLSASGHRQSSYAALGTLAGTSFTLTEFVANESGNRTASITAQSTETHTLRSSTETAGSRFDDGSLAGSLGSSASSGAFARFREATLEYTSVASATTQTSQQELTSLGLVGRYAGGSFALDTITFAVQETSALSHTSYFWEDLDTAHTSGISVSHDHWSQHSYALESFVDGRWETGGGNDFEFRAFTTQIQTSQTVNVSFQGNFSGGQYSFPTVAYSGAGSFYQLQGYLGEGQRSGFRNQGQSGGFDHTGQNGYGQSGSGWGSSADSVSYSHAFLGDDVSVLSLSWSLTQEGSHADGRFSLDTVLYTAAGTSDSVGTSAYTLTESATGASVRHGSGLAAVGQTILGESNQTDTRDYDWEYTETGDSTYLSWQTLQFTQQGGYADGRYNLSSLLYTAEGGSVATSLSTVNLSFTGLGTIAGTHSGGYSQQPTGEYEYLFGSEGSSLYEGVVTRTWNQTQEGHTGSGGQAVLGTITLNATVQESYTYHQHQSDLYDGPLFSRLYSFTRDETGTAFGTLYQDGSLSGETWSISSYGFNANGNSQSTFHLEDLSTTSIYTTNLIYEHEAELRTEEYASHAFTLAEYGSQAAGGTFAFSHYELESSGSTAALTTHSLFEYKYTSTPPPPEGLGQTSSWSWKLKEALGTRTQAESRSLHAIGSGPVDSFGYSQYDETQTQATAASYHEEGTYIASQNPWMEGSWALDSSDATLGVRETEGGGLAALTTHTLVRTQSFARTDWINGNSFPSGDSGTYPLESSWTHPLDAPQPSNLHPKPMIAVADLAVGKNLTGQGILEGVVENIAGAGMVPVVDQSSGGGDVQVFGPDGIEDGNAPRGERKIRQHHAIELSSEGHHVATPEDKAIAQAKADAGVNATYSWLNLGGLGPAERSLRRKADQLYLQIRRQYAIDNPKLAADELFALGPIFSAAAYAQLVPYASEINARWQKLSEDVRRGGSGDLALDLLGPDGNVWALLPGGKGGGAKASRVGGPRGGRPAATHAASEARLEKHVAHVRKHAKPQARIPKEVAGGAGAAVRQPARTGHVIFGELDHLGRPTGIRATITPEMIGTGSHAAQRIRPPGFGGQAAGHARGHLLGSQLRGSGTEPRNLVTLFQNPANLPAMSGTEAQVRAAVEGGQIVEYWAFPVYQGSNLIPVGVTLRVRGSGGFNLDVSIINR